jgi:hypothetical protein
MFVPTKVEGVPKLGVTKTGDVAKTSAPEPVSFVTAAAKFALVGVAKKAGMPVPRPDAAVTKPALSKYTDFPAGYVQKTSLTPAEKLTSASELLDARTVFRAREVPDKV